MCVPFVVHRPIRCGSWRYLVFTKRHRDRRPQHFTFSLFTFYVRHLALPHFTIELRVWYGTGRVDGHIYPSSRQPRPRPAIRTNQAIKSIRIGRRSRTCRTSVDRIERSLGPGKSRHERQRTLISTGESASYYGRYHDPKGSLARRRRRGSSLGLGGVVDCPDQCGLSFYSTLVDGDVVTRLDGIALRAAIRHVTVPTVLSPPVETALHLVGVADKMDGGVRR